MKCPRCKSEVSPNDTECPNCKLKLVITCPRCKSVTRLGSTSCKKCGFVFIKFCPKCNSANYVSSSQCRKCFYQFPLEENAEHKNTKNEAVSTSATSQKGDFHSNPAKASAPSAQSGKAGSSKLAIFIDFTSLNHIFEKFKDEEFKQKVLLNIKTSVKMSFNANGEFVKPSTIMFKMNYIRKIGLLSKIDNFNEEFAKFNNILSDTLSTGITYKFAITTEEEYSKNTDIEQLKYGSEKDIITSEGAYKILNDEISLIKISSNSYKMVFLDSKPVFEQSETSTQNVAISLIESTIEDDASEIKAISLNAPKGYGKTFVLKELQEHFEDSANILLLGQCTPLTQVTPLGLFQDIFLSLFNLTFAPSKYEKKVKDVKELLIKNLALEKNADVEIVDTLINLIYPSREAYYENILQNKQKTFEDLKKILELLRAENKLVLVIDDFDLIDEASYEFLKYLIHNDFFEKNTKLLLSYKNQCSIEMYVGCDKLPKNACLNINLAKRTKDDVVEFISAKFQNPSILPIKILDQVIFASDGNFAYIEQVLEYLIESEKIVKTDEGYRFDEAFEDYFVPESFNEILDLRFEILKEKSQTQYEFLCLASLLGGKFNKSIILNVLGLCDESFEKCANALIDKNYIKKTSLNSYVFKNNLLWQYVYQVVKNDENLKTLINKFLSEICTRMVSSYAVKALIAQSACDNNLAFELWTQNLKLASYIGDVGLYILSQKQSLSLLENSKATNQPYIKNNICERVGKLIYEKNPHDAIEYLSSAIMNAKEKSNTNKVVELSGYLVQACRAVQNYPAIIETVDNILEIYGKAKTEVAAALIKTRKIEALLQIGNWEEVVNIIKNEINPVFEEAIKGGKNYPFATSVEIYKTYIETNILLSAAYAYQGNPQAFETIDFLEREIFKEKNKNVDLMHEKVNLALTTALAYSIKGVIKISDEILQSVVKDFSYAIEDSKVVSKWNLIDLFNKIMKKDFDTIKEDLFEAVDFANNSKDDFSKNILKTLLAYVLLQEGNALKTFEICTQQMNYFANTKIALGALLSWYISAKATYLTNDLARTIEICEKSIKICKDAKINNTYFNILFNCLLGEAYLKKDDLESAKMYTDIALQEAKQNDLMYLQMLLYARRAKCMEYSLPLVSKEKKAEFVKNTIMVLERAIELANKLNLVKSHYLLQKDLTAFKAHCQLKDIG